VAEVRQDIPRKLYGMGDENFFESKRIVRHPIFSYQDIRNIARLPS
jgi:hypothetical protein